MAIQSFDEIRISTAIEPERALNIGLGMAAAPLWAGFFASASAASAWWWTAAWTRGQLRLEPASFLPKAAAAELGAIDSAVCDLIEGDREKVEVTPVPETAEPPVEPAATVEAAPVEELVEIPVTETAAEPLQAAAAEAAKPVEEEPKPVSEPAKAASEAPKAAAETSSAPEPFKPARKKSDPRN